MRKSEDHVESKKFVTSETMVLYIKKGKRTKEFIEIRASKP